MYITAQSMPEKNTHFTGQVPITMKIFILSLVYAFAVQNVTAGPVAVGADDMGNKVSFFVRVQVPAQGLLSVKAEAEFEKIDGPPLTDCTQCQVGNFALNKSHNVTTSYKTTTSDSMNATTSTPNNGFPTPSTPFGTPNATASTMKISNATITTPMPTAVTTTPPSLLSGCNQYTAASTGVITSPNYPRNYGSNENCTYTIQQSPLTTREYQYEMKIYFCDLDLERSGSWTCLDRLQVGGNKFVYCGEKSERFVRYHMAIRQNTPIKIHFLTNYGINYKGFKMAYCAQCPGTVNLDPLCDA